MKNDYSKLKQKILIQVILIAVVVPAVGLVIQYIFIDGLFQSSFAEWFVELCQNAFNITYGEAANIYQQIFRQNRTLWLSSGLFFLLLLTFYIVLSRMTKYFNEISTGLDQLVADSDGEIVLSSELDFLAVKLSQIKSNLEKQKRDARESEQRKNDLVVYLAHDIRTPLTSVIGYLNLLDEAADMPVDQRAKYTGITLEKAYRLEQLINELYEITRFNLQTILLNKEKINMPFMLSQMADEFYPLLTPFGKQVVVVGQDGLTLWGDADKLARVFNNILKNGIAYSYPGSTIEVRVVQRGETMVISFINQGTPIPAQKLNRIFEKFFRLDTARSSNSGGAGLGLAIAKEIITAHGGTIHAESNEKFTEFLVTLPVSNPEKITQESLL